MIHINLGFPNSFRLTLSHQCNFINICSIFVHTYNHIISSQTTPNFQPHITNPFDTDHSEYLTDNIFGPVIHESSWFTLSLLSFTILHYWVLLLLCIQLLLRYRIWSQQIISIKNDHFNVEILEILTLKTSSTSKRLFRLTLCHQCEITLHPKMNFESIYVFLHPPFFL